jgi:hypothetical protein
MCPDPEIPKPEQDLQQQQLEVVTAQDTDQRELDTVLLTDGSQKKKRKKNPPTSIVPQAPTEANNVWQLDHKVGNMWHNSCSYTKKDMETKTVLQEYTRVPPARTSIQDQQSKIYYYWDETRFYKWVVDSKQWVESVPTHRWHAWSLTR